MHPAERLRAELAEPRLIEGICLSSALPARQAEYAGFDFVVLGAGGTANFLYGLPDLGLLSLPEVTANIARVAAAVDIPVIADLDDAGGEPMAVHRTIRLAEQAGAAALMVEDTDRSTKHRWSEEAEGWDFSTARLRPLNESVEALRAAVAARRDPRTIIVGKTDAYDVAGLDAAVERAKAYVAAGAELSLLTHVGHELMTREIVDAIGAPVVDMDFDTPSLDERAALARTGVSALAYVLQPTLGAFYGFQDALEDIKAGQGSPDDWERNKLLLDVVGAKRWTEAGQAAPSAD